MSEAVLIVDDSLTVRMDLVEAFEAAGFRPVPVATIAEAREAFERDPAEVVVLDVLLPDGDGISFLKELRATASGATAVVLMLSTEAEVKDRILGLRTGADEYVGKPYDTNYVVAKSRALVEARRAAEGADANGRASILLIDDSITYRQSLGDSLREAGYRVLDASSGEDGLALMAIHRPTAVVVDGVLPGMDGSTVIRRVRLDAALRRTPCLLLTGSEDREAELRALEAGADSFIRKDEDMEVILAKLAAALRQTTAMPRDAVASLSGPRKILAVDDSPTYLNGLADALRDEGYDVVLAKTGEEALDLLAVTTVDCILLDLLMPGIGGTETCQRIKAAPMLRDIPLILLTAVEDRGIMLRGLSAGADDYISKSSELEVLKARVRAQLRRKQFEDETRRIREELLRKEMEASEARAARELAETRAELVAQLERKNRELEAFSYSVSHDLRAPLRAIDGFSQALIEDYSDKLDATGVGFLRRVRAGAQKMGALIDDMLLLSRVTRAGMSPQPVDLSALAAEVVGELRQSDPAREVEVAIAPGLVVHGDPGLLRIVLANLIGNAWKFTGHTDKPRITVGATTRADHLAYFVRDNGAGFSMSHADKLFRPFQRLHTEQEFPGTGIGLATIYRVIDRHGGDVWAEGAVDEGAAFFFTLPAERQRAA